MWIATAAEGNFRISFSSMVVRGNPVRVMGFQLGAWYRLVAVPFIVRAVSDEGRDLVLLAR